MWDSGGGWPLTAFGLDRLANPRQSPLNISPKLVPSVVNEMSSLLTVQGTGRGAPHLKGGGTGDLKVKVHVVVPKELTQAQRSALETFSAEQTEDLRAHIA